MNDIVINSRRLKSGDLFYCFKNAEQYLSQSVIENAGMIFVESGFFDRNPQYANISKINIVHDLDNLLVTELGKKYKIPKTLIGITGSKGKTSTSWFTFQMLSFSGYNVGYFGTIGLFYSINGKIHKIEHNTELLTTLMIDELYYNLNYLSSLDIQIAIIEVSSHGLSQNRLSGLSFDITAFTSFSQDHLDFHNTIDDYFNAKLLLFNKFQKNNTVAIINDKICNLDKIQDICSKKNIQIYQYGEKDSSILQLVSTNYDNISRQQMLSVKFDKITHATNTDIVGDFQMENIMCASAIAHYITKITMTEIFNVIPLLKGVHGRMERVITDKVKTNIFIDYAHTPVSLLLALQLLRKIKTKDSKLFVVFGCGGNRDALKRPIMGYVASVLSDVSIITNDNPRKENPDNIISDILCVVNNDKNNTLSSNSFILEQIDILKKENNLFLDVDSHRDGKRIVIEKDRKNAIELAVQMIDLQKDYLLIAGKGHETYQIFHDKTVEFSDIKCCIDCINNVAGCL